MLRIQQNVSLHDRTTLKVGGAAAYFTVVNTHEELKEAIAWAIRHSQPTFILGGGSNVLVDDSGVQGLVIQIGIQGREYSESGVDVLVAFGAGEILDTCIAETVARGLWGLENLSGIPGCVGGVPIQNVGAYGVEARDCIESVTVFDTSINEIRVVSNEACAFTYRDSIFKQEAGKKYIVTHVTFRLSKLSIPKLSYKDLLSLAQQGNSVELENIRDAIVTIRKNKFPEWNIVGTAGSFFKNPIISIEQYAELQSEYGDIPKYPINATQVKISLGWILDHICNLRGYREGNVSLYKEQALVLVCERGGTAQEINAFAEKIKKIVFEKTQLTIESEVQKFF